jgi:hypothetical protein
MSAAPIPLVNRALTLLGDALIEDLSEDSFRATLVQQHYEPLVQELLQAHDWNFASKRVANLPALADPPAWGLDFTAAFQLPADCLRVRATSADRAEGGEGSDWQVEGLTIVTWGTPLSIRYTARVPEGTWRPAFATAVVYELAARLAYPITQKPNSVELYVKLAERKLAVAKALDGQEMSPRRYITGALTDVRFGGGGWGWPR